MYGTNDGLEHTCSVTESLPETQTPNTAELFPFLI